jgi:glutamate-1-semialdehyde 2,1-aminomutase
VCSLAAALKVIEILETEDVHGHLTRVGQRLQNGFRALTDRYGLTEKIPLRGRPAWHGIKYADDPQGVQTIRSLFQQEATRRGVLVLNSHNLTYAHKEADIDATLKKYDQALAVVAEALSNQDPMPYLEGEPIESVFKAR